MKDYYQLLQIPEDANADDIKKAFRVQALRLHPDKNIGNEELATQQFAAVQEAYSVLADPKERSWYDSHKAELLNPEGDEFDLMQYFDVNIFGGAKGYENTGDSGGFFAVYRKLFAELEFKEGEAGATTFGYKDTPYIPNVKEFYDRWSVFSTNRQFVSADRYDVRDAENRRIKRLMEKENKKGREALKKEYSDLVRQLAAFVKKRDPRFKEYQKQKEEIEKRRKEEVKEKKKIAKEISSKEYIEPEWAKVDVPNFGNTTDSQHTESDEEITEFYCEICDKLFKSEAQSIAHERSKKHQNRIKEIKQEMLREEEISDGLHSYDDSENLEFDHAGSELDDEIITIPVVKTKKKNQKIGYIPLEEDFAALDLLNHDHEELPQIKSEKSAKKTGKKKCENLEISLDANSSAKIASDENEAKLNKQRRKKNNELTCIICHTEFVSRNQLFKHVKETGHAARK